MKKDNISTEARLISKQLAIGTIKSTINLLPIVGSLINEVLFDFNGRIQQERINSFVKVLGVKFNELKQEKVNSNYLKSNEFFDLTLKIFETASIANYEFKREFLARIYLSSIISSNYNLEQSILFVDFIKSM
ncbi:MAG: hypothetical protein ABL940_03100, partial [Bacteroidia bacterium]